MNTLCTLHVSTAVSIHDNSCLILIAMVCLRLPLDPFIQYWVNIVLAPAKKRGNLEHNINHIPISPRELLRQGFRMRG